MMLHICDKRRNDAIFQSILEYCVIFYEFIRFISRRLNERECEGIDCRVDRKNSTNFSKQRHFFINHTVYTVKGDTYS